MTAAIDNVGTGRAGADRSAKDRAGTGRALSLRRAAVALAAAAIAYQAVAWGGLFPAVLFPGIPVIATTLWDMIRDGTMEMHAAFTLYRVLVGFVLAILVGLPLGGQLRAVDGELAGAGQRGDAQPLRQHVRHDLHPAVGRLGAADDQVGVQRLQGLGQDLGGGHGAGAVQRVVLNVDGLVRTHGERLADGLGGAGRAHGQDRHLAAVLLLDLQRLLDRVLVHLVDDVVRRSPLNGVIARVQVT